MFTTFFNLCESNEKLSRLLDSNDGLKIYLAGDVSTDVSTPYVTATQISGYSYNALSDRSSADNITLQIDVWSSDYHVGHQIVNAVRYAVELVADITALNIDEKDRESGLYRTSFDIEFIVNR